MNGLMVRKKKYRFQVEVRVEELQHVPFVNCFLFAKVRLLDGGFTDLSPRLMVADHAVRWDSRFTFTCKMTANASTGELDSCMCRVSVRQEVRGGKSFQKLGYADVNLAEFAGSGGCQRYLLEAYDSKHRLHNSMLKVTVDMILLSGDPCFKAQPSRVTRYQQPAGEAGVEEGPPSRPTSGSLASLTSSGYDSLKKKVNEVFGDSEEGEGSGGGGWGGSEAPGGHSRNSSNTSHASGYASINSQSEKSGHIRNSSAGSGGGGSSEGGGCSSSMGGSLERPNHSAGPSRIPANPPATETPGEEASKKSRVDDTRFDANDIIDKLFQDTIEPIKPDDSAETSGLQLYIGRDGSATLGGKSMGTRGEFKPVVIDKR